MKTTLRYIVFLFISVVALLEIGLHIYNPFHFRIKGERIVLETNKKYTIDNSRIPVLDPQVNHTRNELGFRGPAKPTDAAKHISIIAIGGSTTECFYLDDSKTWPQLLYQRLKDSVPGLWLNNAGLAGHSTHAHSMLLKEHIIPLRPDVVLLLTGANDIRREKADGASNKLLSFFSDHSQLYNLVTNLRRFREAEKRNLTDTYIDPKKADSLVLSDDYINNYLSNESMWVNAYTSRLQSIIHTCRANNITPILVTQPSMVGKGIDPISGVSLETIKLNDRENGKLWWMMLEKYNEGTRAVARTNNIPLIDLALELPKSSEYFYDIVHFTNAGASRTAAIIYDSLLPLLQRGLFASGDNR